MTWYDVRMGTDSRTVVTSPPPTARMSYEQFLDWHPDSGMAEWIDGEALIMAPPSLNHQRIGYFLARCVSSYVESKDLGEVFIPPVQMKLAHSGREPDVLF